jgi:hypothetical protein
MWFFNKKPSDRTAQCAVIPAEAGIQRFITGFRILRFKTSRAGKCGMTKRAISLFTPLYKKGLGKITKNKFKRFSIFANRLYREGQ